MIWLDFWKELNEKHKISYNSKRVEYVCHSDQYEYAGTIDLVAKVDGIETIFDWKTGNYLGNKDKQQMTAYMHTINVKKAAKQVD